MQWWKRRNCVVVRSFRMIQYEMIRPYWEKDLHLHESIHPICLLICMYLYSHWRSIIFYSNINDGNNTSYVESMLLPAATKLGQGNVFTGVCDSVHRRGSASVHAGMPDPPWEQTPLLGAEPPLGADPPRSRHPLPRPGPPGPGTHPPRPGTPPDQAPPSLPGSRRQHTVNERPVRTIPECILVSYCTYAPHDKMVRS